VEMKNSSSKSKESVATGCYRILPRDLGLGGLLRRNTATMMAHNIVDGL